MEARQRLDGVFGLLDENLILKVFANLHERANKQAWCLVCKRFLQVEAISRKKIELQRVDVVEEVLQRYSHVEHLDLSPCIEVGDDILEKVGTLSRQKLRGISLARLNQFTQVGLYSLAVNCVGLRELDLSFCCQIDDDGMFVIAKISKIETLMLANCRNVTDLGLAAVARSCTALRKLSLRWCTGITDNGISVLAANCRRIESLDLSYTEVTKSGLDGLRLLGSLQKLYLAWCTGVDDSFLKRLWTCSKSLMVLDLAGCRNVSDKGILSLVDGPIYLRELYLSYCLPITNALLATFQKLECLEVLRLDGCDMAATELASIGKSCKSLKEFSVSKCGGVTDLGISAVVKGCRHLRELDVTCCHELTDISLCNIARYCPNLRSLKTESCSLLSHKGLEAVASGCRCLETLDLTDCNVNDEGLKWVAMCTHLKILKLGICPDITDKGIRCIATRCRSLLELDLYRCGGVGDSAVARIASGCSKIRVLNISYCSQVTDAGLFSVSRLHELIQLDMRSQPLVTSAGLSAVAAGCMRLVKLDIKRCTGICDAGLLSVALGCPKLREVNLSYCKITNVGLLAVAKLGCMQNMKLLSLDNVTVDGLRHAVYNSGCIKKVKLSMGASLHLHTIDAPDSRYWWMMKTKNTCE